MEHQLFKKLLIKDGQTVLLKNAPDAVLSIFGAIPAGIKLTEDTTIAFDTVLLFVKNSAELTAQMAEINLQLKPNTLFWILYPKKSSGIITDLNIMSPWDELKNYQLSPCASAAVNETWTALRIKPIALVKASGVCNDDIQQNEYGNYVDVKQKIVTLPEDLKVKLEKQPSALSFYEQLSYSNRKEYVLWVLTAKQEKTRLDRIAKTVAKLLAGKKNPTEK